MAINRLAPPNLDRIREAFLYDAETGVFVWARGARKGKRAGSNLFHGYRRINIDGVTYREHQLAWYYVHGVWPQHEIDHINSVRADNRIANLRDVVRSVNAQNRKRVLSATGFMGVTAHHGRYQAQINIGRFRYLGMFDTPHEAHEAYEAARKDCIKESK